jgi:Ca2+-binding EF-hand superfamily protein
MKCTPLVIGMLALCWLPGGELMAQSAGATPGSGIVSKYDKDSDQTLDLAEVKDAASAHFDKLDKDADGTLDSKEVKRVIGAKTFKAADPDNDGTLSKDEYLALVERLFKKADVDNDGTLTAAELKSPSAHALKRLIN